MTLSLLNTVTDAERRVLEVLFTLESATRADVVAAAGLADGEAENSLDSLWRSGFVGCATTYFAASGGPAADDWRYSLYARGREALRSM